MNRDTIIGLLQGINVPVVPWSGGTTENGGRFCMVRPGGIAGDRNLVDVWMVNAPGDWHGNDPDHEFEPFIDEVYNLLRLHLVEPAIGPAPDYTPRGGGYPRSAMLLTGAYPTARGIG